MTIAHKLMRLTELMKKSWVAKRAGVTVVTLDNALTGKHMPSIETCKKLAGALGVEAGWLMDDSKGWPPVRAEQHKAVA